MWLCMAPFASQGNLSVSSDSGVHVSLNEGSYSVSYLGWTLSGRLDGPVFRSAQGEGRDSAGRYREIRFDWGDSYHGAIRCYDARPGVKFSLKYGKAEPHSGIAFPSFTQFPAELMHFSYRDGTFAPRVFDLAQTSTPWLLFDKQRRAMVFSPASQFMIAKMVGDGKSSIGEGLNDRLQGVPKGLEQDSVLTFADGIGKAWGAWGDLLRGLYGRKMPAPSSDALLQKFGYWTDNGADYYYNYDLNRGYANTLLDLVKRYREEQIPMGYLQLDSWWYEKSVNDPGGKPGGAKKSNRLPYGPWNRYGGLMEYRADPDLFPSGLSTFQRLVGLPMATHNRWIDRTSPYHEKYKISGIASVDPAWWKDTMDYLSSCGVTCYEQDWLDPIYANSPEMPSKVGVAEAFTDGMASAARSHGMTMQYCMATPRFFLQGVKYPNLTTIRPSGDRFEPRKWADFLFTSQLAWGAGEWPWCDVFKSSELGNLTQAVLSGGPVGTGDEIGKEVRANILSTCLPDGTIVRPDVPIVPCDQTYEDYAAGGTSPFVASTFTLQSGLRTAYVFAFPRPKGGHDWSISLHDLSLSGPAFAYDLVGRHGQMIDAGGRLSDSADAYSYWMAAPVARCGAALLGDLSKLCPTGRARVEVMRDDPDGLEFKVHFAKGEKGCSISVWSANPMKVSGKAQIGVPDANGIQSIEIPAGAGSVVVRLFR